MHRFINCCGKPHVCLACAGACRGTIMFKIVCLKITAMINCSKSFSINRYKKSLRIRTLLSIVCLTRVWQSLLPLFCDKTFEFTIQTWQTSLEHYYVYVQTYFLSQLSKMLILLISSYCKMCTLPTLRSRVFVCCEQYKHARSYCW